MAWVVLRIGQLHSTGICLIFESRDDALCHFLSLLHRRLHDIGRSSMLIAGYDDLPLTLMTTHSPQKRRQGHLFLIC